MIPPPRGSCDCQSHIYDGISAAVQSGLSGDRSATFTEAKIRIRISHALIAQLYGCQGNGCIDELR